MQQYENTGERLSGYILHHQDLVQEPVLYFRDIWCIVSRHWRDALSVLICYPDIHELDGIKVLQSRTGHYQLISKPSIREGVVSTSLLFQKIGLDKWTLGVKGKGVISVLPGNTYLPTCIGHRNILFLFVMFQRREMTRVEVWMMISEGDKIRRFWKWAICTVETHKQAKVWVLKPPSKQCDWKLLESWQKARKNVWRRRIFAAISKADYLWLCFTPSWWPRRPTWWRRTA